MAPGLDIDLTQEYGKGAPGSPYRIGKPIPLLKGGSLEDDSRRKFAALRDVKPRTDLLRRPGVTVMTPAVRRAIAAAKADDAFGKRYVSNDRDAVDYMHALHRAAYPELGSNGPNLDGAGDGGRGAPRRGPVGGSAAVSPLLGSRNDLAPWMSGRCELRITQNTRHIAIGYSRCSCHSKDSRTQSHKSYKFL